MKNVISLKDLEQMVRNGQSLNNLPADSILTPSAREFLQDREMNPGASAAVATAAPTGKPIPPSKPLNSKSSKAELDAFFMPLDRLLRRHAGAEIGTTRLIAEGLIKGVQVTVEGEPGYGVNTRE